MGNQWALRLTRAPIENQRLGRSRLRAYRAHRLSLISPLETAASTKFNLFFKQDNHLLKFQELALEMGKTCGKRLNP